MRSVERQKQQTSEVYQKWRGVARELSVYLHGGVVDGIWTRTWTLISSTVSFVLASFCMPYLHTCKNKGIWRTNIETCSFDCDTISTQVRQKDWLCMLMLCSVRLDTWVSYVDANCKER